MAKFTYKDTGEEIKVGDVIYYTGDDIIYSNGTRRVLQTIKSCEVKTISNFYINRNLENDIWDNEYHIMITKNDKGETFTINDNLYSSKEAVIKAIKMKKYQKSISEVIFKINNIDKIEKILNLIGNNIDTL